MMKTCPYCGTALNRNAAAICPKCKKSVSGKSAIPALGTRPKHRPQPRTQNKSIPGRRPAASAVRPRSNSPVMRAPGFSSGHPATDDGYDGYYNDVPTDDEGIENEKLDPAFIKRVAMIAAGTILMVVLSIIVMNLL